MIKPMKKKFYEAPVLEGLELIAEQSVLTMSGEPGDYPSWPGGETELFGLK